MQCLGITFQNLPWHVFPCVNGQGPKCTYTNFPCTTMVVQISLWKNFSYSRAAQRIASCISYNVPCKYTMHIQRDHYCLGCSSFQHIRIPLWSFKLSYHRPVVLDSSLKSFSSMNLEHLHQQNRNLWGKKTENLEDSFFPLRISWKKSLQLFLFSVCGF